MQLSFHVCVVCNSALPYGASGGTSCGQCSSPVCTRKECSKVTIKADKAPEKKQGALYAHGVVKLVHTCRVCTGEHVSDTCLLEWCLLKLNISKERAVDRVIAEKQLSAFWCQIPLHAEPRRGATSVTASVTAGATDLPPPRKEDEKTRRAVNAVQSGLRRAN